MVETLLAIGIVASVFVGFNIGGSSTGIAWGPPVGAGIVKKTTAAALMTFFVFLGGWTIGRNVMDTLSEGIITIDLTLTAGVAVLFFIGLGILIAKIFGVPSMMMGQAVDLSLEDHISEAAAERAEPVFERAREIADERGREINTVVGVGHPARNILDRSEEYDTIVLGAHGEDWSRATRRFLIGNITETVSKRAPVPVIIVR
jgi:nucleotide-binding universal stress UspA family protein